MIYFSIYQIYNNCYNLARVWAACGLSHFAVDSSMTCDIVAGEQGSSCLSLRQVPDLKVIHICFIPEPNNKLEAIDDQSSSCTNPKPPPAKKKCASVQSATIVEQKSQATKKVCSPSKFVPRSQEILLLACKNSWNRAIPSTSLDQHCNITRCF